ncbi:MAG: IS3 family transposase [Mycoplasmoidaceae bacterium]|nr:MAG: IS3 family transposase [Mycoplasmoidaceae bacterium]
MKHSPWFLKEEIVLRYVNGETLRNLGKELVDKNYASSKVYFIHAKQRNNKYRSKPIFPGIFVIKPWYYEMKCTGFYNLIRHYKMRKRIKFPEDYSKEELAEIIQIQNELIKKHINKINKDDIKEIKNEKKLSISNNKIIVCFHIPNSSYYKKRISVEQSRENNFNLNSKIVKIWEDSKENYGYRKITNVLRNDFGLIINAKRVLRLCNLLNIHSIGISKKARKRDDLKAPRYNCENLINRNFIAEKPNQKCYTDVTYIPTPYTTDGFWYVSGIIDGCGWIAKGIEISDRNNTDLAIRSITSSKIKNCILHMDHGWTYASYKYNQQLKNSGILQSMSRKGNSLDNRPIEYFWRILKYEWIYKIPYNERTYERMVTEINNFTKWYNETRIQSCLNYLSPEKYISKLV